ncbi:SpoU rRNA Methylase family protein [Siphonobacter aquaeclarae]|uniref:SpoU rRNA Methylase family protein n=2 Tax=Siphonobacter aquaeclarae TaxID=563176 RepID=A0A1G9Q5M0_9BACT|nr:SpoU rRNA Methylase family protein [Siphonobacter aquaeclarae]
MFKHAKVTNFVRIFSFLPDGMTGRRESNPEEMVRKRTTDELNRLSVADFKNTDKFSFSLLLDDVRSLNNVGSVFRTADAFRASTVYLGGITGRPPHRDITKTALGADESVHWEHIPDCVSFCRELQAKGVRVVAVEQAEGSVQLPDFKPEPDTEYVFVFGNEVFGVNDKIMEIADACLEIPQFGTKHSLNISVTVGIICWDFVSKQFLS